MRLIVAITGASGVIYGVRLLEVLKELGGHEVYLIVTKSALKILHHELDMGLKELEELCDKLYSEDLLEAPVASGSFLVDAMVVIPCSMKTLAAIANCYSSNLVARAAEVTLKERRRLIVVPRETPLTAAHIRNMLRVTVMGGVVLPACPAFYHKPKSVREIVDFVVGKVLDLLNIRHNIFKRWE